MNYIISLSFLELDSLWLLSLIICKTSISWDLHMIWSFDPSCEFASNLPQCKNNYKLQWHCFGKYKRGRIYILHFAGILTFLCSYIHMKNKWPDFSSFGMIARTYSHFHSLLSLQGLLDLKSFECPSGVNNIYHSIIFCSFL